MYCQVHNELTNGQNQIYIRKIFVSRFFLQPTVPTTVYCREQKKLVVKIMLRRNGKCSIVKRL
jgi:hypothetical protein